MTTNEQYTCLTLTNGDGMTDRWELNNDHHLLSSNLVL